MRISTLLLLSLLLVTGCASGPQKQSLSEQMTLATVWVQQAAEYRALCYQAYSVAQKSLDQILKSQKNGKKGKPLAVVFDIDETVLDNSYYQARNILKDKDFPDAWKEWTDLAKATPVPGALEFIKYAKSKGVEVFYVTNRKGDEVDSTMKNMKEVGFPITKETLLVKIDNGKKERRELIEKTHKIVMLVGDNMNDFSENFEKKSVNDRFAQTDKDRALFGAKYIVLPNPMYGDWEAAIYENNFKRTNEEKDQLRKNALKGF